MFIGYGSKPTDGAAIGSPQPTGDQLDNSVTKLAEIREIIYENLFPIFTGMVSSEIFSGRPNHGAISSYIRLKELLEIGRGCGAESINAVRAYQIEQPREYARIVKELAFQVAVLSIKGGRGQNFR